MPAGVGGGDMSHSKALALHNWGKGTPVALGGAGGKKRRREDEEDSDEVSNHLLHSQLSCF